MHDFSATLILHKRALISNEHSISLLLGITSCSFAGRIARRSDQHSKNSVKFFIKFCTPKRWEIWAFFIRAVAIFSWYYLVFGGVLPQIAFKPFIITFFFNFRGLTSTLNILKNMAWQLQGTICKEWHTKLFPVPNDKSKYTNKWKPVTCL